MGIRGIRAAAMAAFTVLSISGALAAQGDPAPQPVEPAPAEQVPADADVEPADTDQSEPADANGVADVRGAVARARAAVAACKGKKGAERSEAMNAAAAAWRNVAQVGEAAGSAGVVARGWYESGVVLRRTGRLEEAGEAMTACLGVEGDAAGKYAQRAHYERAQVRRRLKDLDGAIADYRAAAGSAVTGVRAHESRLWVGRCLSAKGARAEAITEMRAALENATNPKYLIKTCNQLAKELIVAGELDNAASVLAHAESATAQARKAATKRAASLQKALDGMSARRQLQRARDEERGAADDAVQLEEDGGGAPAA